jgi:hypothetical protein
MKNESSKKETKKELCKKEHLQNCNCKRFEQKIDGRFYCRDCGKVEYTVL